MRSDAEGHLTASRSDGRVANVDVNISIKISVERAKSTELSMKLCLYKNLFTFTDCADTGRLLHDDSQCAQH